MSAFSRLTTFRTFGLPHHINGIVRGRELERFLRFGDRSERTSV